jgi:hypothetical protein
MFLPIKRWIKPSIVVNAMQQSTVFLILYEMFKVCYIEVETDSTNLSASSSYI